MAETSGHDSPVADKFALVWRDASDGDLAAAVQHVDDYEPAARSVILAEAARRGISIDDAGRDNSPPFVPPDAILLRVRRLLATDVGRVALALLAGILGARLRDAAGENLGWLPGVLVMLVVLPAVLYVLSHPLLRYALAIACGLSAYTGALAQTCWAVYVAFGYAAFFQVSGLDVLIHLGVGYAIYPAMGVAAVYIRRRFWPVYPQGQCQRCGYPLKALTAPRCPECGTTFDPQLLSVE